jgi:hypothetical protein
MQEIDDRALGDHAPLAEVLRQEAQSIALGDALRGEDGGACNSSVMTGSSVAR